MEKDEALRKVTILYWMAMASLVPSAFFFTKHVLAFSAAGLQPGLIALGVLFLIGAIVSLNTAFRIADQYHDPEDGTPLFAFPPARLFKSTEWLMCLLGTMFFMMLGVAWAYRSIVWNDPPASMWVLFPFLCAVFSLVAAYITRASLFKNL